MAVYLANKRVVFLVANPNIIEKVKMSKQYPFFSSIRILWSLTPKIDRATWPFVKFDIGPMDMRQGLTIIVTCDIAIS